MLSLHRPTGWLLAAIVLAGCGDASPAPDNHAPENPEFVQISAGGSHSCALSSAGKLFCWGANRDGQLGNGAWNSSPSPTMASVLQSPQEYVALDLGSDHTCALAATREAYCWGGNEHDQLGYVALYVPEVCFDGPCSTMPSVVLAGFPFASLSAGDMYTCAGTPLGTLYCWGKDNWGETGTGFRTDVAYPRPVAGHLAFREVSTGTDHTCGVTLDGEGRCWGRDDQGQLGSDTTCGRLDGIDYCTSPKEVSGGLTFAALAAGDEHSCGLTPAGRIYCWGDGGDGALGNGSTADLRTPAPIQGGRVFVALTVGMQHACGITDQNEAYCWGLNDRGQLGIGETQDGASLVPAKVLGDLQFEAISAGGQHTCGLTLDHVPYCWGANGSGQLGDGSSEDRFSPVPVTMPG